MDHDKTTVRKGYDCLTNRINPGDDIKKVKRFIKFL